MHISPSLHRCHCCSRRQRTAVARVAHAMHHASQSLHAHRLQPLSTTQQAHYTRYARARYMRLFLSHRFHRLHIQMPHPQRPQAHSQAALTPSPPLLVHFRRHHSHHHHAAPLPPPPRPVRAPQAAPHQAHHHCTRVDPPLSPKNPLKLHQYHSPRRDPRLRFDREAGRSCSPSPSCPNLLLDFE